MGTIFSIGGLAIKIDRQRESPAASCGVSVPSNHATRAASSSPSKGADIVPARTGGAPSLSSYSAWNQRAMSTATLSAGDIASRNRAPQLQRPSDGRCHDKRRPQSAQASTSSVPCSGHAMMSRTSNNCRVPRFAPRHAGQTRGCARSMTDGDSGEPRPNEIRRESFGIAQAAAVTSVSRSTPVRCAKAVRSHRLDANDLGRLAASSNHRTSYWFSLATRKT
jgi:hypothetical protein